MVAAKERSPELQHSLQLLEKERLSFLEKRRRGMLILTLVLIAFAISALGALTYHGVAAIVVAVIGMGVGIATYSGFISSPFQAFRTQFKEHLIGPLIRSVANDVRYIPLGDPAIMHEYRASELYPQRVDRSSQQDTLFCSVGATDVKLSEIHTEYKTTTTDSKGRKKTQWHTIFKGLFISADFHKDFRGKTFVRADVAEKTFGLIGRFLQKPIWSSLQLIELEDPEFEKQFVVRGSDQVEARYLLSPSIMQRMTAMKQRFAANIEFSFVNSRMFIAIETKKDFFEPDQFESLLNSDYVDSFLAQVHLCLGVVEELGLNTRIWTKQ